MSINATLFFQIIVFFVLVWFTMKFVWPPITKALDERAQKIADGLSAAERAKTELAAADQRVKQELAAASNETATRLADAERRAQAIIEEAKARAASEGDKITRVIIILDDRGTLIRVQVVGRSGVTDLDDAAVEAFRAAAPFPNPPKGIVEADGTIKIRWDFVLEA